MFRSILLSGTKYSSKIVLTKQLDYNLLAKLPVFTATALSVKNQRMLKKMYFFHCMLCYKYCRPYLMMPATLSFLLWAIFVSFKPIFHMKWKMLNRKAGTKKKKFEKYIKIRGYTSKGIVKHWMARYCSLVKFKKPWKRIAFIYDSLIRSRSNTPMYNWYMKAVEEAMITDKLWRKPRSRRRKHRIRKKVRTHGIKTCKNFL